MASNTGSSQTAEAVQVQDRNLSCPICGHDRFRSRKTLLNTRGLAFFNVDWLNRRALNYICDRCGYIYWFAER